MSKRFMLLIKVDVPAGNMTEEAFRQLRKRLPFPTIAKVTDDSWKTRLHKEVPMNVLVKDDDVRIIYNWFGEDAARMAPFPNGTLLYFTELDKVRG